MLVVNMWSMCFVFLEFFWSGFLVALHWVCCLSLESGSENGHMMVSRSFGCKVAVSKPWATQTDAQTEDRTPVVLESSWWPPVPFSWPSCWPLRIACVSSAALPLVPNSRQVYCYKCPHMTLCHVCVCQVCCWRWACSGRHPTRVRASQPSQPNNPTNCLQKMPSSQKHTRTFDQTLLRQDPPEHAPTWSRACKKQKKKRSDPTRDGV